MQQHQTELRFTTKPKSLSNITSNVEHCVATSGFKIGMCYLFVTHTSASLLIQENASPEVLKDFEDFFAKLVPEKANYRHADEGPDDMPAHIRTALTKTSEAIPIRNGKLALGTWQGIYLWEHRAAAHERKIVVHVVGE